MQQRKARLLLVTDSGRVAAPFVVDDRISSTRIGRTREGAVKALLDVITLQATERRAPSGLAVRAEGSLLWREDNKFCEGMAHRIIRVGDLNGSGNHSTLAQGGCY
jgi:hypothetical protein